MPAVVVFDDCQHDHHRRRRAKAKELTMEQAIAERAAKSITVIISPKPKTLN